MKELRDLKGVTMRKILAAVAVTLVGGGAAAQQYYPEGQQQYRPAPTAVIDEESNLKNYYVTVNEEIRARFVQPAGPYSWQLQQEPSISLNGPTTTEPLPGRGYGSVVRTFRFRATRSGRFGLVFAYRSTIPGEMRTSKQVIVFINVAESKQQYRPQPQPYQPQPYRPQPQPYPPQQNGGPDTVEPFTARDAGQVIDVPAGQEQTIVLPSNASTGYYWKAAFPTNFSLIDDIREERARGAGIGAGGTSIVRFRINRQGPAEVTMLYLPPDPVGNAVRRLTFRFRGI